MNSFQILTYQKMRVETELYGIYGSIFHKRKLQNRDWRLKMPSKNYKQISKHFTGCFKNTKK